MLEDQHGRLCSPAQLAAGSQGQVGRRPYGVSSGGCSFFPLVLMTCTVTG